VLCKIESDRKVLYIFSLALSVALLASLFIPGAYVRAATAVWLLPAWALMAYFIKKRAVHSMFKRQVLLIISVIGLIYLMVLYLSGLSFGFGEPTVPLNFYYFFVFVLPIAAIIVFTELIRGVIAAQRNRLASALMLLSGVLGELVIAAGLSGTIDFSRFMELVGLFLFPAVVSNLVYNYLAVRYGVLPSMVLRLMLSLYPYLIPVIPLVPDALLAFSKLILPLIVYGFIDVLFEKKKRVALQRKGIVYYVGAVLGCLIMTLVIMLVSCRFKYGLLVIATGSMADEINPGDAVIYESYDGQTVEEGQVIVFERDGLKVVHRVVEIERVQGQNRYYTKGDANDSVDVGFVVESEIVGFVNIKLSYVGYPTLWLRNLFR